MTIEKRVAALEKAVKALQAVLAVLSKAVDQLRALPERARRQPGSQAKLTHAQWLARKREVAARIREKRWPKKKATKDAKKSAKKDRR